MVPPAQRTRALHTRTSTCVALVLGVALAGAARGQSEGPAARLHAALPELFASESVEDAAAAGAQGARVVAPTPAQRDFGLQAGDVVLAVEGHALAGDAWSGAELPASPVLTVLRPVAGERPVLPAEVLANQVLEQFVALPGEEQRPMRLARMLANQLMLVKQGLGVILVPPAANRDDAAWLRVANPMPAPSEAALQEARDAVLARARLPAITQSEAEAAETAVQDERWHEARERAARALTQYVCDPANRGRPEPLAPLVRIHSEASREVARERRELMSPGPRFALVLEGLYTHVGASLPQNILLEVDGADEFSFAAGARVGLFQPAPTSGPPILGDVHLLVEYGFLRADFAGPTTDQTGHFTRLEATQHRISGEIVYRPRVLSRLRPQLRGGPALFRVTSHVFDDAGLQRVDAQRTTLGWLAGAGIDLYSHAQSGLRAALVGYYQRVEHEFCPDDVPEWEDATNILQVDFLARPTDADCISPSNLDGFVYLLDMSSWNVGLMLAYEF